MKILILDNYDSFTYNLVQLVRENTTLRYDVIRNNEIEISEVEKYDYIILSPGPGLPAEAGIMCELIKTFYKTKPILGVCLGMQAIAEVLGGKLYNLDKPLHGVSSEINITSNSRLFKNIPEKIKVGRYHSWAVCPENLPEELKITAIDNQNVIMAIEHCQLPVYGVQFHPESILTEYGNQMIINFIESIS